MSEMLFSIQWKLMVTFKQVFFLYVITSTFLKILDVKSIRFSAVTVWKNCGSVFFQSREADFSTRVSKNVFPLLRVSMTPVIIVYYGLPSKMKGDDDVVGKAPLKFREK